MTEVTDRLTWTKYLRFVTPAAIGTLLLFTFRLYRTAYFWLDDFNNLHWVSITGAGEMLKAFLNPVSGYFRPTGMAVYWLGWNAFGMTPLPYHLIAWTLHAGNTGLVYTVLKRMTGSSYGASIGAMLFASQAVFADIYWSFGTIFELVSGMLFFLGILLWSSEQRTWKKAALSTVVFVFAFKGKEMAITLPVVWLAYDLIARSNSRWRHALQTLVPGFVGLFYALMALSIQGQAAIDDPYYRDVRALALGRSFGFYFNALFGADYRWQKWAIGFVVLILLCSWLKNRLAVFFQLYVFITFLPVIFLVNHSSAFYWYIPFLGVCGLAALAVDAIARLAAPRIPPQIREITAGVVFIVLCALTFFATMDRTAVSRPWHHEVEVEYRSFISGLLALPEPPLNETLYFDAGSKSLYLDKGILERVPPLALHRQDLQVKVVEDFPAGAAYRLKFEEQKLIMAPEVPGDR